MTADVLASIDGALCDWETSGDAMRWVPEESRAGRPLPAPGVALSIGTEAFAAAMNQLTAAMGQMMEQVAAALRPIAKAFDGLFPVLREADRDRAARLSAMHRDYRRRCRSRRKKARRR